MTAIVHGDYSTVTELPGGRASQPQLSRLRHRYHLAATRATGRDVLEVACGAGLGLGWLGQHARRLVGGDFTVSNLRQAQRQYRGRVPLLRFDAAELPFPARTFDLVLLFEALYYIARPEEFVAECARVLRPNGFVVIGAVNPEWRDFHPSPLASRYYSAAELHGLLSRGGFRAEIFGAFGETAPSARRRVLSRLKRAASRAGLIPNTLRGREALKRLFHGPLERLPAEIVPNGQAYTPPSAIDPRERHGDYTVLYAVGRMAP